MPIAHSINLEESTTYRRKEGHEAMRQYTYVILLGSCVLLLLQMQD